MARTATVTTPTTGCSAGGSAVTVPPGTYEVFELDGIADTVVYVGDGEIQYRLHTLDPNVTITED